MNTTFTDSEIQHYRDEGYVVIPELFDADILARTRSTINEVTETAIASGEYKSILELEPESDNEKPIARRIYNPFVQHENFAALATDERILDRIEQLVGPDIELHHSKLNMKPARVGSVVEWHQDLTYYSAHQRRCACRFAVP